MARPRNNAQEPPATERIMAAFWHLLEDHAVKDVTISMVAAEAGCNRGTFYYHFSDMDDLMFRCIENELMGDGEDSYAFAIFRLLTKPSSELLMEPAQRQMARKLCLLVSQGGMEIVDSKMKAIIFRMWRDILCDEGQELSFESLLIIEYSVSGLIALFNLVYRMETKGEPLPESVDMEVFQSIARIQLARLASCENVELPEMLMRLKVYDKFMKNKS